MDELLVKPELWSAVAGALATFVIVVLTKYMLKKQIYRRSVKQDS